MAAPAGPPGEIGSQAAHHGEDARAAGRDNQRQTAATCNPGDAGQGIGPGCRQQLRDRIEPRPSTAMSSAGASSTCRDTRPRRLDPPRPACSRVTAIGRARGRADRPGARGLEEVGGERSARRVRRGAWSGGAQSPRRGKRGAERGQVWSRAGALHEGERHPRDSAEEARRAPRLGGRGEHCAIPPPPVAEAGVARAGATLGVESGGSTTVQRASARSRCGHVGRRADPPAPQGRRRAVRARRLRGPARALRPRDRQGPGEGSSPPACRGEVGEVLEREASGRGEEPRREQALLARHGIPDGAPSLERGDTAREARPGKRQQPSRIRARRSVDGFAGQQDRARERPRAAARDGRATPLPYTERPAFVMSITQRLKSGTALATTCPLSRGAGEEELCPVCGHASSAPRLP